MQREAQRGWWVDSIIEILREKKCATLREIARELGVDPNKPYLRLVLKRLVDRGVLKRRARGFYCFE